jgi:hypothetical protein
MRLLRISGLFCDPAVVSGSGAFGNASADFCPDLFDLPG